jgi:hypothetical protein
MRLEIMDDLNYTTITELAEPIAGRRGSALVARPSRAFESGVAAALCHRTPKRWRVHRTRLERGHSCPHSGASAHSGGQECPRSGQNHIHTT